MGVTADGYLSIDMKIQRVCFTGTALFLPPIVSSPLHHIIIGGYLLWLNLQPVSLVQLSSVKNIIIISLRALSGKISTY